MASVNKVILVGHLGRDPEIRYTPEGEAICNLSLATTSQWKDKQTGERKEETEWHRVVAYKRLAEIMGEYLRKGRPVYIEGRLKTRKWQDKDTGQDRYSTEIVADQMQMLGGRDDGQGGHAADAPDQVPTSRRGKPANDYQRTRDGSQAAPATGGGAADMDDDIPFAPVCTRRALHTI